MKGCKPQNHQIHIQPVWILLFSHNYIVLVPFNRHLLILMNYNYYKSEAVGTISNDGGVGDRQAINGIIRICRLGTVNTIFANLMATNF